MIATAEPYSHIFLHHTQRGIWSLCNTHMKHAEYMLITSLHFVVLQTKQNLSFIVYKIAFNSKDLCHHSQPHTYQPTSKQKNSKEFYLHQNKRTRRSSSGLLPFIGEMSNVLFGTATEKDVRNQQVGVDKAVQIGNINARELKYLGNALKEAMVIHVENMGFNLEAVMANTRAVQNISMAFGRYTVRKHIEEQLLSSTRKLQLILLQSDLQFQLLISDVIALKNGLLRPTLVTYDEMLQFMEILSAHLTDKQFRLPTVSEMFQSVRLYTTPALVGNVLIVTFRVSLHSPSQSFSLLKSNTFPLPIHGHLSQIVGIPR